MQIITPDLDLNLNLNLNLDTDADADADFVFEDLGAVDEVTGVYSHGNNRDGGWEPGHNYSYE